VVQNSRKFPDAMRNKLIAKIHVAKKQLKLADDDYRGLILGSTDGEADSCKDCNEYQLEQVLAALTRQGFTPVIDASKVKLSPKTKDKADPTQVDAIRALWIDLANKGVIRNRSDDAIQRFAKRLTQVDRLEWLDTKQCQTVLAALNNMKKQAENKEENTEKA
jgi:phage gp16-like protein